jgi:hypothetical protein
MASRWVWRVHILKDVAVPDENALPNHTFQGVGLSRPLSLTKTLCPTTPFKVWG